MEERPKIGFIVEGHCEYDSIPSFVGKILGYFNFPIQNAKGIGNILRNLENELYLLIKIHEPQNIIISLDYLEAYKEGYCADCIDLKRKVYAKVNEFIRTHSMSSLVMPENVTVVIADKTFDSWLCSDLEGLKCCSLINPDSITEIFVNTDEEIDNPGFWLKGKTKDSIDFKNRRYRKALASSIRPEVGELYSRSFRKFIKEVRAGVA